jgi:large subunit ribosomal protein L9
VSPSDIVAAVAAAGGPEVDKRKIEVGSPIKTVGVHEVTVRLHADVSATVRLDVVPA